MITFFVWAKVWTCLVMALMASFNILQCIFWPISQHHWYPPISFSACFLMYLVTYKKLNVQLPLDVPLTPMVSLNMNSSTLIILVTRNYNNLIIIIPFPTSSDVLLSTPTQSFSMPSSSLNMEKKIPPKCPRSHEVQMWNQLQTIGVGLVISKLVLGVKCHKCFAHKLFNELSQICKNW